MKKLHATSQKSMKRNTYSFATPLLFPEVELSQVKTMVALIIKAAIGWLFFSVFISLDWENTVSVNQHTAIYWFSQS